MPILYVYWRSVASDGECLKVCRWFGLVQEEKPEGGENLGCLLEPW